MLIYRGTRPDSTLLTASSGSDVVEEISFLRLRSALEIRGQSFLCVVAATQYPGSCVGLLVSVKESKLDRFRSLSAFHFLPFTIFEFR